MSANEGKITRFPGGIGQFTFVAIGAAAGDVTVAGVKASDQLLLVESIAFAAGVPSAVADLTSEFSVKAANQVNNTGGTSTADRILLVTVARTKKE